MPVSADDEFLPKVRCPNPAHDTLKFHFQINQRQPTVHCFAYCGISGSYEHAVAVIEGLYEKFDVGSAKDERERKRRTDRARRQAGKIILKQATGHARDVPHRRFSASESAKPVPASELQFESYLPPAAIEFLDGRGITGKSVAAWNIGWDAGEARIVIPGKDEMGRTRLLIKRGIRTGQHPKYLYSAGYPKTSLLFGACQLDPALVLSQGLGLVEGSFDTIVMHQHGLRFFAGILGTGISEAQARIVDRLRPKRIFLFFDKDSAGIHNIEIASERLRKYPLYVVRYPKGKSDPAELTEREAQRAIDRVISLRKFKTARLNVIRAKGT